MVEPIRKQMALTNREASDGNQRKGSFDFPLFFLALSLWIIGIFLIYSATYFHESGPLLVFTNSRLSGCDGNFIIMAIISIPGRLTASHISFMPFRW